MIFSLLQLYNISFATWSYAISAVISIIIIVLGLAYIFKLYKIIKNYDIKDTENITKYKGIYRMYKDPESAIFECITVVKKFLFSLFLVALNSFHPFV
jgi:hypothetical protein